MIATSHLLYLAALLVMVGGAGALVRRGSAFASLAAHFVTLGACLGAVAGARHWGDNAGLTLAAVALVALFVHVVFALALGEDEVEGEEGEA